MIQITPNIGCSISPRCFYSRSIEASMWAHTWNIASRKHVWLTGKIWGKTTKHTWSDVDIFKMAEQKTVFSMESKRAIIWFCWKTGRSVVETKAAMLLAYGEDAPAESTIRKWFRHFEQGNIEINDNPRLVGLRDEDLTSALVYYLKQEPYASAHCLFGHLRCCCFNCNCYRGQD